MEVGLLVVDLDALGGEAARRGGDHGELDAPEATVGVQPPARQPGTATDAEPDVEGLLGAGEPHHHLLEVERHAAGGPAAARGVDEEVEQHLLARRSCEPAGTRRPPGW